MRLLKSDAKAQQAGSYHTTCLHPAVWPQVLSGVCLVSHRKITPPFCNFLCPDAGCQMPSLSHTLAWACTVFISVRQEMFASSSHLHHTPFLFCFPQSVLQSLVASHIPSLGAREVLGEFISVCFISDPNIFSGSQHYCFCVKCWNSKAQ